MIGAADLHDETLPTLRVRIEGAVTSFRYPHFVQGVQPTYLMPPPATLYGHVCSALGEMVDPVSFRVALHFTSAARWYDYEHTHLFGGEAKLSPFERELLFQPRLTLYIDRPDWLEAFRHPRYVVTLGRSQDLMRYAEVSIVHLKWQARAYVEHTLIPFEQAHDYSQRVSVTMPSYVSLRREALWKSYAMLGAAQPDESPGWVDMDAPRWKDRCRRVHWLELTDRP